MRLAVVIPAAHNVEMTAECQRHAQDNATLRDTVVGVFDNGVGWGAWGDGTNIGNYPAFYAPLQELRTDFDVALFIHNDLYIWESGYDARIIEAFEQDDQLGLLGFVGSPEFDHAGGRGYWAWSNFQGLEPGTSHASEHGIQEPGFRPAANLDGCALAFRIEALNEIPRDPDFPPHHFYDRVFCCEMLSRGWHVGYLGIGCDHLNGQTANVYAGYKSLAAQWCEDHDCVRTGEPDHDVYLEAEAQFQARWREELRFIPLKVGPDHTIYHTHWGL